MIPLLVIFDLTIALTLVWLAWHLLASADLFKTVVLFISFGLLMALVWVRLKAPDVALTEAAIGAGLTGAILLSALRRMARFPPGERRAGPREEGGSHD